MCFLGRKLESGKPGLQAHSLRSQSAASLDRACNLQLPFCIDDNSQEPLQEGSLPVVRSQALCRSPHGSSMEATHLKTTPLGMASQ